MRLAKIGIRNFKGLRAETLEPSRFTCLVGENNAGKSTVLQAITIGLRREPQLGAEVFYDPAVPIEFRMEFADIERVDLARLADEHREKLQELVMQ